jgi:hypothetical protein
MSRFGAQYQVARPTGVCAASGEPLEPGVECVAVLCETPEDGFERHDFSPGAWERGERPEGLFSYWKTVVPEPQEKRRLLVDDAVLVDLFERLADDDRPQRIAFRFVLGLILLRKRKLKFVGREQEGDEERWKMLPRPSDPDAVPMEVVNPRLSEDDVRELTGQLSEILQSEL